MTVAQNTDEVYYCDPGAIEVCRTIERRSAYSLLLGIEAFIDRVALSVQVAGASASDTTPAIAAVHAAVSAIDVAAADAVHHCFSVMSSHIQRLQVDQAATVQALQASQVSILVTKPSTTHPLAFPWGHFVWMTHSFVNPGAPLDPVKLGNFPDLIMHDAGCHSMQADNAILQREIVRMRAELAQLGQATGLSISGEAPDLKNLSSNRPRKVKCCVRSLQSSLQVPCGDNICGPLLHMHLLYHLHGHDTIHPKMRKA